MPATTAYLTLSIIIVNYNVKHFLEQCLHSVGKAVQNLSAEIIVVDNHSTDGSLAYLQPRFSTVTFLSMGCNSGFAKACNHGLQASSGEYVLFLNPDTIVAEDSFEKCITFFKEQADCGAIGVKMIDGSGVFLKESKRAFPSPLTSLFKLAGLASLFPTSPLFSRYHLGHLSKTETHEVDVLAGAFLLTKRSILQTIGGFDEAFFMYGEDVDLSYRIQKAGFKNFYFPHTTIIHFKGESTKRGSLNYVRMFYQAMMTFVQKHYGGTRASIFTASIRIAIWMRGLLAALFNVVRRLGLPLIDATLILFSFWSIKEIWEDFVRPGIVYPTGLLLVSFPAYTLLYLTTAYYAGLYDRQYKRGRILRATLIATAALLSIYALLPEAYRFSRAIVVLGAVLAFLLIALQRRLLAHAGIIQPPSDAVTKPQLLIAASPQEFETVKDLLQQQDANKRIIGRVAINGNSGEAVAHIRSLAATADVLQAKELIFCAGSLSYESIIQFTKNLQGKLRFRYHALGSQSFVGSDASTSSGETFSNEEVFALQQLGNRRLKRLIDVAISVIFVVTLPVHCLMVKHPLSFIANCFAVLLAKRTWIGYTLPVAPVLPRLQKGVLPPTGKIVSTENSANINYWYARNWEALQDVRTIFNHYKKLGGA